MVEVGAVSLLAQFLLRFDPFLLVQGLHSVFLFFSKFFSFSCTPLLPLRYRVPRNFSSRWGSPPPSFRFTRYNKLEKMDSSHVFLVRIKIRHYRRIFLNRPESPDPENRFCYRWQWTLQSVCMMTSFVFLSCILIVIHLVWLLNFRGNQISFDFFTLFVYLIIESKGFCWFDFDESIGHEDFHTPWPFISVFHTTVSFHPLSSPPTSSIPFPRPFSSVIHLRVTCWVFILSFHWVFFSSYF